MSMARITSVLSMALVVVILVFASSCFAADDSKSPNIAPNPGAEKAVAGKLPEGWGRYHNTPADMGATDKVFHSGKNSVFLKVTGFGKDGLAVTGLAAGKTDGYSGPAAISVQPYTKYNFSFYIKGKGFTRKFSVKPWGFKADGSGRDRDIPGISVLPTDKWTRHTGSFTTRGQTERVALMFFVYGKKDRDVTAGATFYVDDVNLSVAGAIGAEPRDIVLPEKLTLASMMAPNGTLYTWADIESKFKAGDPYIRGWVGRAMKSAKKYADKPDSYYLGLFRPESPFGVSTITCPFHPEMFGWIPFEWSPEQPWRLVCPHCREEGRKPYHYPNQLYPDDGKGCEPTDEVWRKTHTPEWSKKYSIPWEKWDGHTHGHIDGFNFFFLGHAQYRIFFELNWRHNLLGNLCSGYVFGSRLYPAGSDEAKLAAVCAGKAKIIMVTMTRAIMGDSYLRDVLGMSEQDYRKAIVGLAKGPDGKPLPWKDYPGYEKRDVISDHSAGDPKHPLSTVRRHWRAAITRFPSSSHSDYAGVWLGSYAKIQSSFTPAERKDNLAELIERLLVSETGDAQRLAKSGQKVKKGVCELGMKPYKLSMRGNLAGGPAWSTLNLGLMIKNQKIIRNVAAACHRYLQPGTGYFTADGLGYETSPHYTQVALNGIAPSLAALNGMTEGFGPGDPFWDPKTKSLNPYLDPALERAAYATLLSVLPDGRCAPWVDSWITDVPSMNMAEKVANATGRVPDRFKPWLDVSKDDKGKFHITLKKELTLPSYLLPANRLAVMRAGKGLDQTFVSVDWSKATGHSHSGPFNLLLYGARHEMLFDQGYLNNVTPTQAWMNCAESHNTALVRQAGGSAGQCVTWRGALRFFTDTPTVKAVEVAQAGRMYQRTVTLMAAGNPYVVDIFRLQGGTLHDYYVHSLGETLTVSGATLKPVADQKKSLYDVSGFKYRTNTGAKVITGISRVETDGAFTATWRDMKDWRTIPPEFDKDAVTRVRILAAPGTEILVGKSFGQRYIGKRDVEQRVTLMCVRRKAEAFGDKPDAFIAVIDAVRGKADNIKQVSQLKVLSGDKAGVAVKITRAGGVDYVLSTTSDDVATTFADGAEKITLTGRLGVIRCDTGKDASLVLLKGKKLTFGDKSLSK